MTTPFTTAIIILLTALAVSSLTPSANALGGSASTVAVVYGSATTICTIIAQQPLQQIQCWQNGQLLPPIIPNTSFDYIAGGRDTLCATRSGGFSLLCWNTTFNSKRLYNNYSAPLTSLTIGDTQICGLTNISSGQNVICWRGNDISSSPTPNETLRFRAISSGLGFSCGVVEGANRVLCWGDDSVSLSIQSAFSKFSMLNIQVGGRHACGMDNSGFVICKGNNNNGQLDVPSNSSYEYIGLALGSNHCCAIRRLNRTVVCWGGNGEFSSNDTDGISFESIVAGLNFTCGLTTSNFSVICWGPGWPYSSGIELPLQKSLPGPCLETPCECNIYPESQTLCFGNGHICRPCDTILIPPPILPPSSPPVTSPPPSRRLRRGLLAFAIVGSVGGFAGICTVIYCLWTGVCFGKKKIHNSVQPTITGANAAPQSNSSPPSRSSTLRRQGSILMRRQRSGTSSKHADRAEELLFSDLASATNNFSLENKIGAGSFGVVYKGKLPDGREVAIKRGETSPKTKKFQEKESAFESELAFLSRLHHKHLVRLVGYCEERDERLLVYEYMKNGALYDHLHDKNNAQKSSSAVNSWKMRIKISLDAARGIEYLHNYAVPPIIHRDIKSSNILLDANWTARVSDFGLSLMGPENVRDYRPMKAAGTVGYIDPEYYGLNVLTAKSDVYGLGVVLLELLTGKRALFKTGENGGEPISVVNYAVPAIMAGELAKILDPRVGPPDINESEAVELVAFTAMHCVHLEGKDRPSITDIVSNLERAFALCDDSHGSISSGPISIVSD
ncbi:putative serine/threonine-protein kinase-like protein CCR3 [Olea europaea var. sylvestris]|uniref:putative serine/threonine-protein kinase-like protein CCR3 n=1 Tax=Olea europaea var. sylvestris TaxID=158386 RepID=UPI000C1D0701|nr:putative serine/threonine-protein kinase-like protein CCR3 [Olea europaea var. sylvestris]